MIYFPLVWSVQISDFRKSSDCNFSVAVQALHVYPYIETIGPSRFWNEIVKGRVMPSQIPRLKVSCLCWFFFLINYFHTQEKMSHTQELYSAAGFASKSESEGGIRTLDIFSHKICEPQKYVNYTHIFACSFQRNSLHCIKKSIAHRKLAEQ